MSEEKDVVDEVIEEISEESSANVEDTIVALIGSRDIHVLKAVAYSLGEQYATVMEEMRAEGNEEDDYNQGYVSALKDIYSGIITHINELSEQYAESIEKIIPKEAVFDHQDETPQEETNE